MPRWLARGFALAVALVVLLGLADLVLAISKPSGTPAANGSAAQGGSGLPTIPSTTVPKATEAPRSTTAKSTSTTKPKSTSTTGAPGGGAPRLVSVTPRHGRPGEVVVVHGVNLFSSNGVVVASVDGHPTGTSCPSRTACRVTIPQLGKAKANVPITIRTAAGTSNAIFFRYR